MVMLALACNFDHQQRDENKDNGIDEGDSRVAYLISLENVVAALLACALSRLVSDRTIPVLLNVCAIPSASISTCDVSIVACFKPCTDAVPAHRRAVVAGTLPSILDQAGRRATVPAHIPSIVTLLAVATLDVAVSALTGANVGAIDISESRQKTLSLEL
jgi:hypothetical protein